jgi:hypothetical protein
MIFDSKYLVKLPKRYRNAVVGLIRGYNRAGELSIDMKPKQRYLKRMILRTLKKSVRG